MTITLELPEDLAERLQADARAQGKDMTETALETLRQRYAVATGGLSLGDELRAALGPGYPGAGGDSRLSEVEAACDAD